MSDVEFETDQQQISRSVPQGSHAYGMGGFMPSAEQSTALSRLCMRLGIARTQRAAQRAMLAIAILALAITAFLAYKLLFPPHANIPKVMPPFIQY